MSTKTNITVEAKINAPVEKVWKYWAEPGHIEKWAVASDDWQATDAKNDVSVGGKFSTNMAAKDGSFSFEFGGFYTKVEKHKVAEYEMTDGRKVKVTFSGSGSITTVTETFEAEDENPIDMQQGGWQAILDSMKKYIENN